MKHLYLLLIFVITTSLHVHSQQISEYLTNLNGPRSMAINGSNLYFSETNGNISIADLTQTTPSSTVYSSDVNNPLGMTFYGSDLYIADFGDASSNTGKIVRINTSNPSPVAEDIFTELDNVAAVMVYNDFLYCSLVNPGSIVKFDLTSTNPTLITVVPSPGTAIFGLEVYDDNLYFVRIEGSSSAIFKLDLTDSAAEPIRFIDFTSDFDRPLNLRLIGTELFLPDFTLSKIFKIDLSQSAGVLEEVVSSGIVNPRDLISFNQTIYITETGNDRISIIEDVLGVGEFTPNKPLSVYPNPANDVLNVANITEPIQYSIYNLLGQAVFHGKANPNEPIDVSALNTGMYIINFDNGLSKKFLKH